MTLTRRALEAARITQRGLAHAIGVSLKSVNAWANGRDEPSEACRLLLVEVVEGDPSPSWLARLDEGRRLYPDGRTRQSASARSAQ